MARRSLSSPVHYWIVSYDIGNDKRRRKISKLLEGYGRRVQFSVFECRLNRNEFRKLRLSVHPVIDLEEDHLRYYPLCSPCFSKRSWIGPELEGHPGMSDDESEGAEEGAYII